MMMLLGKTGRAQESDLTSRDVLILIPGAFMASGQSFGFRFFDCV
jgi:hypothetical protein